jgi:hypothetical protein
MSDNIAFCKEKIATKYLAAIYKMKENQERAAFSAHF